MKSKLLKNSIKEIKDTFKRFVSIFLMAFLGVGFFAGLVAAGPDMRETLDQYFDEKNVYDISVISTMGLTEEDINEFEKIENIESAYGVNSKDEILQYQNESYIGKFIEINKNINDINLKDGRMPENDNECLIDNFFVNFYSEGLGDTIKTEEKEYKIVGTVQSPLYITSSRGTTNIGSGSIDLYLYVNKIEQDYYTNIYLKVNGARELTTDTKEYNELVNKAKEKVEEIKSSREQARYNEIRKEAEDEVESAKQELENNREEVNSKLQKAENQIKSGENSIKSAKNQIAGSKLELNKNKTQAEESFKNAESQIEENSKKIEEAKENLDKSNTALSLIIKKIEVISSELDDFEFRKKQLESLNQDTSEIDKQIIDLQSTKNELNVEKDNLEGTILILNSSITDGEKNIQEAKESLDKSRKEAYEKFEDAEARIIRAENEVRSNEKTISKNKEELERQKDEANKEFDEAEEKIREAEQEIEKIEKPTLYINLRNDNSGYGTYIDSVASMVNIAKLFPLVFYIIAILTSLTSMTRMVEEERTEIGTLKALGYSSMQILGKYILYSLLACVTGGILGMALGFKLLPNIIWTIYKIIFEMGDLSAPFRMDIGVLVLGIAIICIVGATIFACMKQLRSMPAKLMRPKVPKSGKRIALEKINFIWKRLNFSQKVTLRNIFRYKKRAIMTIVGITGCTALILAGFGLKDSVTGIVSYQYGEIFNYQDLIVVQNIRGKDILDGYDYVETHMKTIEIDGKDSNLVVADNQLNKAINFYDKKTGELVKLDDEEIFITEKLADLINVKEGDSIKFNIDEKEYSFKIKYILKNYIYNYVYISKTLYENTISDYEVNTIMVNDKLTDEKKQEILDNKNVLSLVDVEETMSGISDMLSSLNYVILVLIVSAALLAFVVLYNLANINIGERIREIATLKVLGFYDNEVDNYISKETRIFTIIGIVLGLGAGYILCNYLISTCEVEMVRFVKEIKPLSYIYSITITVLFTMIVNIIVHKTLKKVDMIESLKSVE